MPLLQFCVYPSRILPCLFEGAHRPPVIEGARDGLVLRAWGRGGGGWVAGVYTVRTFVAQILLL